MNPSAQSSPRRFLSPLSILILLGLGSRIFLLNWNRGEYTDGLIQLQLFEMNITFFAPLYTVAVDAMQWVAPDPVLAGRLVSLLASTLTLIPLYHLARLLFGERAATWCGLFFLVSAVPNRWALRVMSDSLFTLFFTSSLMAFFFSFESPKDGPVIDLSGDKNSKMSREFEMALSAMRRRRRLYLAAATAGLATLTRYQGLALVPLLFYSLWKNRKGLSKWESIEILLALLPWAALLYWTTAGRGFGHTEQFTGRVHESFAQTLLIYWHFAESFLIFLPYALAPPVAVLALYGFFQKPGSPSVRRARWTLLFLFVLWLPVHAAFQSFQYRYFLPLIPLFTLFAGAGIAELIHRSEGNYLYLAKSAGILAVAWSLGFSVAVIGLQRNAFAALTEAGRFAGATQAESGRVLAAEPYNVEKKIFNVKLNYWAGRPITFCEPFEQFPLQPGDLLVISNVYNSMDRYYRILQNRCEFEVIYETRHYRSTPLLPDIMTQPPGLTSQPMAMAYRYHQQEYYAYVIRINGVRQ
jgi:hypothetical protein